MVPGDPALPKEIIFMGKIIGIDLGTTNSLVAFMSGATPRIIGGIVPSVVGVNLDGDFVVGRPASETLAK